MGKRWIGRTGTVLSVALAATCGGQRGDDGPIVFPLPAATVSLESEAVRGTLAGADRSLGDRVAPRRLPRPHPARGTSLRFSFDGGKRGWVAALPLPELLASPAFAAGRIFLGGGFSSRSFFAFSAWTGELDWTLEAPDGGPTSAIAVEDRVVFNTESCTLFVADAATGRILWRRWLGDPLMSQPAAAGGLIFSAYPVNGGHALGAFALADGAPAWTVPIPADVIQAPRVAGDSLYLATMDGTAFRISRRTGHVVWRRAIGATSVPAVEAGSVLIGRRLPGPVPREQHVVLSAADGRVLHEGEPARAPYLGGQSRDRRLGAGQSGAWGSVSGGQHLGISNVAAGWALQGSTPAVADGRAYFAAGDRLEAREIATGRTLWTRRVPRAGGAQALSPPAVVGSAIVYGSLDGHLYATDIDTGMTLWAWDVGEPIVFQPIVAQGWVYCATAEGNLIGLEIADPAFDGWHMWGGNPRHAGLVEGAGTVDPTLLESLERPTEGTLRPAASAQEPLPDLPLAHTDVVAKVSGFTAEVTVTQRFQNPYDRVIEAVYLFPLPADAAVDDMKMTIGARSVQGRIQRRDQARRTYARARAEGRRAALLEQERPNLFAQRVANIGPGERIDVRIRYVEVLGREDGRTELVFPMVAERRFDPAHPDPLRPAPDPLAPAPDQPMAVAAAPAGARSGRSVDVRIEIDAGLPLGEVVSPSHRVGVTRREPGRATVLLRGDDRIPDRDLVVRWSIAGDEPAATVLAHRGAAGGFYSLLVQPPAAPAGALVAPRRIDFVVDTSRSMAGRPLEQARAIVDGALATLRPDDTFGLLRFGDEVVSLGAGALAATPENLALARSFLQELAPNGATNLVPALEAALAPGEPGRVPIVVLVSDGLFAAERDALGSIARHLGDARLFTVGVGPSPNRFLLERASEVGRGRALIAALSEPPRTVAERFASLVDRPVMTDVEVDWGGLDVVDSYPRRLPDVFAGSPLVVHGRYHRGGRATVRVRGKVGGAASVLDIDVALPERPGDDDRAAIATIWARSAIHERTSLLTLRDDPALVREVTELGLRHRIVTDYTSFVAVDEELPDPGAARPPEPAAPLQVAYPDPPPVASSAVVMPDRTLPGDPEVRIPAPRDARAVTVVLPFGESVPAVWEETLGLWTACFVVPADAPDGPHPVDVLVTHRDGRLEHLTLAYTVDTRPPVVRIEIVGDASPGAEVLVRARQILPEDEAERPLLAPSETDGALDGDRVELRTTDGRVFSLRRVSAGAWEGRIRLPEDGASIDAVVTDVAGNVRVLPVELSGARAGATSTHSRWYRNASPP
ncbi:MAG: PQQ-binding-like beta-propeller repeat protein [Deltaproteobacteria bacterium]|nr:PQQ-binding-like beta-propeller repeat protein [Deltaproteobacteria bacterium]